MVSSAKFGGRRAIQAGEMMPFSLTTFLSEAAQILDVPVDSLDENSDDTTLRAWDSMRSMMLVMMVETNYGVSITDEEAQRFTSIRNIVAILTDPNRG
jgi:acyl carrier protein